MKCKVCKKDVVCPEHMDRELHQERSEPDDWYIYCGICVVQYQTALGAMIHDHFWERLSEFDEEDVREAINPPRARARDVRKALGGP